MFGRHKGHQPVVTMTEVTAKLKKEVQTKANHLESAVLPRVEKAISRVDHVSAELTAGAKNVRIDIQAAADCAVSTIDISALVNSNDCKRSMISNKFVTKHLDRQADDLKRSCRGIEDRHCVLEEG